MISSTRSLGILVIPLSLMLASGAAMASGDKLDPRACPMGDWVRGPSIPQDVTNLLCSFLLAIDTDNRHAARDMTTAEVRSDPALPQLLEKYESLRKSHGVTRPDRIVLGVVRDENSGQYLFRILDRYGSGSVIEKVSIRAATSRLFPPYADTDTFDVAITRVGLSPL